MKNADVYNETAYFILGDVSDVISKEFDYASHYTVQKNSMDAGTIAYLRLFIVDADVIMFALPQ